MDFVDCGLLVLYCLCAVEMDIDEYLWFKNHIGWICMVIESSSITFGLGGYYMDAPY